MAEIPASFGQALAGVYRLDRVVGEGGMATVFLAHDLKHDRPVALKVLRPELAHALGPERFEREIRLAARLQHPHILTVHDSGVADARLWFTMPYVEGESLRTRLNRERQLSLRDALRIAHEAAQALQYAHEHGIVHRDIKPDNILLTKDGSTLVADFGIARALGAATDETLTQTGMSVGTPAYMSPEQAAGDRGVDARSDIYSLGVVLYEMLAGEQPFTGPTAQAIIAKRFSSAPPSVRASRPGVPEAVDRAVQRALALVPGDRFSTAAGFAEAVDVMPTEAVPTPASPAGARTEAVRRANPLTRYALTSALALGLLIGAGVLFAWRRSSSAHDQPAAAGAPALEEGATRVAVLPFENLGDSADAYFADGVADAVRGKLTALPGIEVIARGSSVQYTKSSKPQKEIAAELGARYLLTGTVRWAKSPDGTSRVQVSPELVEVGRDGAAASRWQQPFDAPLTDVFKVQADIAGRVAQAMRGALAGTDQARLGAAPTTNPAAYDAYLRGQSIYATSNSPAVVRRAIAHFERAVAVDSNFALAWSALARARGITYINGTPSPQLAEQTRIAAERALQLDSDGPDGHRAMSMYHMAVTHDYDQAAAELEAALARAPSDAAVLANLGTVSATKGRWEEALSRARAAWALDPRSQNRAFAVANALLWLRRPAEARAPAERAVALAPRNPGNIELQAMIALSQGDLSEARRILAAAKEADPAELGAYVAIYWDLGWVLDDAGRRLVLSLGPEAFDDDRGQQGIVRAQLLAWRGDSAQARKWGDTAQRYFAQQLRATPDDAQRHVLRALALAYAGHRSDAIAEGERGVALRPLSKDAQNGAYYLHQLIRTYLLVGEREKALDGLETLMRTPYYLSPRWLQIDPDFQPLRGNPRFERLLSSAL